MFVPYPSTQEGWGAQMLNEDFHQFDELVLPDEGDHWEDCAMQSWPEKTADERSAQAGKQKDDEQTLLTMLFEAVGKAAFAAVADSEKSSLEVPRRAVVPGEEPLLRALDRSKPYAAGDRAKIQESIAALAKEAEDYKKELQEEGELSRRNIDAIADAGLKARLCHVASLVERGCPASVIVDALKKKFQPELAALDVSGVLTNEFAEADFKLERDKNWYYRHRHPGRTCPQEERELTRANEIWQAQSTNTAAGEIITISNNGTRVESWQMTRNADRQLTVRGIEGPDPVPDREGLTEARNRLFTLIMDSRDLNEKAKLEMIRDLTQMESRARSGQIGVVPSNSDIAKNPRLKQEISPRLELASTYTSIARLLQDKSGIPHKVTVARQLARELGDPSDIDQGAVSDACRIVTAQYRLATMRPSVVARMTVEALLDGKVSIPRAPGVAAARTEYTLPGERAPSSPQAIRFPRPADERSYASQLFQLSAMNVLGRNPDIARTHVAYTNLWAEETGLPKIELPPGCRLEFIQEKEKSVGADGKPVLRKETDPAPFLVNNGMRVQVVRGEGNSREVVQEIRSTDNKIRKDGANHILLEAYAPAVLLATLDPGFHPPCVVAHSGMEKYTGRPNDPRLLRFDTPQQLATLVQEAKRQGNLPLIIASRDYGMAAAAPRWNNPADRRTQFEEALEACHNTHIMIIKDIICGPPMKLVTDDFFGKSYDRRVLPMDEWERYFMRTANTEPLPKRETAAADKSAGEWVPLSDPRARRLFSPSIKDLLNR